METVKESNTSANKKAGRPKGSENKVTATAKENVLAVFTRLGGTAAMADWAKENRTEFYKMYARLIPQGSEVSGPNGGPIPFDCINVKFC